MIQQKNDPIWNLTREQWFQAVCFALCFLAFMLAEAAVNARAAVLLGPPWGWSAPAWVSCRLPCCGN